MAFSREAAMSRTTSENATSSPIVGLMFDGFGLEGDGMGQWLGIGQRFVLAIGQVMQAACVREGTTR
jgi:hypothetical protein